MTDDPRLAALAEALHDTILCLDETHLWPACEVQDWWTKRAAAILAALDGWDLVRVDDLGRQIVGLYIVERDKTVAEIARLKHLHSAHHRMLRVTALTCDACRKVRAALEGEER